MHEHHYCTKKYFIRNVPCQLISPYNVNPKVGLSNVVIYFESWFLFIWAVFHVKSYIVPTVCKIWFCESHWGLLTGLGLANIDSMHSMTFDIDQYFAHTCINRASGWQNVYPWRILSGGIPCLNKCFCRWGRHTSQNSFVGHMQCSQKNPSLMNSVYK